MSPYKTSTARFCKDDSHTIRHHQRSENLAVEHTSHSPQADISQLEREGRMINGASDGLPASPADVEMKSTTEQGSNYPESPIPEGPNASNLTQAPRSNPPEEKNQSDGQIVTFDGPSDAFNPLNWPLRKKLINTMLCALTTMGTTWASSMYVSPPSQISLSLSQKGP